MLAYDRDLARDLADFCAWIYGDDGWREDHAPIPEGFRFVGAFRDRKAVPGPEGPVSVATSFAALAQRGEQVVLAFRGTEVRNLLDWLRNLDARKAPFRVADAKGGLAELGGTVHAGFLRELAEVFRGVVETLGDPARGLHGREILCTGHSQGGAVAILAAAALARLGHRVVATYAFAAPKPAGRALVGAVPLPVYRIEHGHDIVPNVPPDRRLVEDPGRLLGVVGRLLAAAVEGAAPGPASAVRAAGRNLEALAERGAGTLRRLLGWIGLGGAAQEAVSAEAARAAIRAAHGALVAWAETRARDPLAWALVRLTDAFEYEPIGTLRYIRPGGAATVVDPDPGAERDLLYGRPAALPGAGPTLTGDHAIAAWRAFL